MNPARIDSLVWLAIYLGLLVTAVGISLQQRGHGGFGWTLVALGLGAIALGGALVWLRSRMTDDGR